MIFSDRLLSQKLERSEARANAAMVDTRRKLMPKSGAEWLDVAGAYAMFDGEHSPLTQSFGLGLFDIVTDTELEKIEKFFKDRHAPVCHEVSPLADNTLLPLLHKRGYRPVELTSVMYMPIEVKPQVAQQLITTRLIREGEGEDWAKTAALGWSSEGAHLENFILEMGNISAQCPHGFPFLAEREGQSIATGMLFVIDDVAILAGASTIPLGRQLGAQTALLEARLRFAESLGAKIALICAAPGSQSQRNAEKHGFRIAYTRIKWQQF